MNFTKNIGFLLLSIWLILTGLSAFISMGGLGGVSNPDFCTGCMMIA